MLDAIQMNYYCRVLSDRRDNCNVDFDFSLLDELQSEHHPPLYQENDDEYKSIWVRIKNPTYDEFKKLYLEESACEEEDIKCEYEIHYYDEPYSYYQIVYINCTNGYKGLFVNHNVILTYDTYRKENTIWHMTADDIKQFLAELNILCNKSVQLIKEGTYQELLDDIPYRFKTGTVKQKDIENVLLGGKPEYDFENKAEFLSICEQEDIETTNDGLKEMTAQLFFDACKAGYDENDYDTKGHSSKECYQKFADGRDEGLTEIDENSSKAFEDWYTDRTRMGGHPWEVCMGGNSTHIDLYVCKNDNGYYFDVVGKSEVRCEEAINFYIAIRRMGLPVCLSYAQELERRMRGEETVGVVPNGIIPRYCESYFPKENIVSFMNIFEEEKDIVPYVKWKPFYIPKLK